jgi:hypothetical protein
VESNRPLRRRFVDEGADPTEDIARTMTVLDDPSERCRTSSDPALDHPANAAPPGRW